MGKLLYTIIIGLLWHNSSPKFRTILIFTGIWSESLHDFPFSFKKKKITNKYFDLSMTVLCRDKNLVLSNELINVELPP